MFTKLTVVKKLKSSKLNSFKLLMVLLCSGLFAKAQSNFYQPFSIGAGFGATVAVAGEQTITSANAAVFSLNYHFTPFISAGFEGQFGQLTSGDARADAYGKQFINDYKAITFHIDVQAGDFIDYEHSAFLNGLKNLHAGIGLGILSNNISAIALLNPVDSSALTYVKNSTNLVVPLRLGYEFKIFNRYDEPKVRLDLSYEFNTAFGAGLDGYTSIYSKSHINFYNYFSVSLKYSFGSVRPYGKQISFSNF